MTITDATHALARAARLRPPTPAGRRPATVRLTDAMARVEPSWVEAVAVVQSVCAQLGPGQAAPALESVSLSAGGTVTIPTPTTGNDVVAVRTVGQMLLAMLKGSGCPMAVWDAVERAVHQPARLGTVRAFEAELAETIAPAGNSRDLQEYFEAVTSAPHGDAHSGLSVFGRGVAHRTVAVVLWVAACGIGAGMSMGVFVASKTQVASTVATAE